MRLRVMVRFSAFLQWPREYSRHAVGAYLVESTATRLRLVLTALDCARRPTDMNAPGWRLHPLHGDLTGLHAVNVSGNWRVLFRFADGHAWDVDYVDYH